MYYRILLVLLGLCHHALSQPVSDGPSERHARELECCPCPGSALASSTLPRAGLDNCPCRPRDADSDGASSFLFPSAMYPKLSPIDAKQDAKNILEPEVTLATSMLDTLREATEEEYRDALEREAARTATDPDAAPEESANNLVIFVNPRSSENDNDYISEASHVTEARCIHPLQKTALDRMRSSTNVYSTFPESIKLPTLEYPVNPFRSLHPSDSNMGASDVNESVVDVNGNQRSKSSDVSDLKFRKNPLDTRLGSQFQLLNKPNINSIVSSKCDLSKNIMSSLVPESRTNIITDNPVSTDIKEQLDTEDNNSDRIITNKFPVNLRNLLKLKDVELIPKSLRNKSLAKPKLDVARFSIPTLIKNHKDIIEKLSSNNKDSVIRNQDSNFDVSDKEMDTGASRNIIDVKNVIPIQNDAMNFNNDEEILDDENSGFMETFLKEPQLSSERSITDNKMESKLAESSKSMVTDCLQKTETLLNTNTNFLLDDLKTTERENDLEKHVNQEHDSDTDSYASNTILLTQEPQIEQSEDTERNNKENSDTKIQKSEVGINHGTDQVPTLHETLPILSENVVEQLENLEKPAITSHDKFCKTFELQNDDMGNDQECVNDKDEISSAIINDEIQKQNYIPFVQLTDPTSNIKDIRTEDGVSINDLQSMSDKLLNDKDNFETKTNQVNRESESKVTDNSFINSKVFDPNDSMLVESDACPTDLQNVKESVDNVQERTSAAQEFKQNEMDTGASHNTISTLPGMLDSLNPNLMLRSPLLEEMGLQPPSDSLDLLNNPMGGALKLNTNLPTLDELRQRLNNIFNTNHQSLEDYSTSLESDMTNDSPVEKMFTDASTRNPQIELPLIKSLHSNINFNQIKTRKSNPLGKISSNKVQQLNSYIAHLPSPTNLDLKSLKVEPFLINRAEKSKMKNFGTDKALFREVKPIPSSAIPTSNFATLDDLTNEIRSKSNKLLNLSPHALLDSSTDNFNTRDIEDVAKKIKLNTEKTVKGIQRKMKSSFRTPMLQNSLSDSFSNSQNLLDDMNDKLKGIHYDLNDRLSSIRESILDSTRIKKLNEIPRKSNNRNVMTNLKKAKANTVPIRFQTAASTVQNIEPHQYSRSENDRHIGDLRPRNHVVTDWNKSRNTQNTAGSSPAHTRIKIPSSENQLQGNEQHFEEEESLREIYPTFLQRNAPQSQNMKTSPFKPISSRRRQPKVLVSFGTTTPRSIELSSYSATLAPKMAQTEQINNWNLFPRTNDDNKREQVVPKFSLANNSLRTLPTSSFFEADYDETLSKLSSEESLTDSTFDLPDFRELTKPMSDKKLGDSLKNVASLSARNASKPKVKVNLPSEAEQSKSFNLVQSEQLDMLRSPTENSDITILDEPLKENVSYKCRIVCTKEIR